MPTVQLRHSSALTATLKSYDETGGGVASLPIEQSLTLPGTATNVNEITIRAAAGTAATLPNDLLFSGTSTTNDVAATITYARPLGGSGLATMAKLRAIEIRVSADPETTAEIEAGIGPLDRTTNGTIDLTNFGVGQLTFEVSSPREVWRFMLYRPIEATSLPALTLSFNSFSLRAKVEILTICES